MLSPLSLSVHHARTAAVAAVLPLSLGLALTASSVAVADRAHASFDRSYAAAGWQGRQLDATGAIPSPFAGFEDWGLTLDSALAFAADGRHPEKTHTVTAAIRDHWFADYATFKPGPNKPRSISANATAKTLVVAKVLRRNTRDFGGHDVRAMLLDRMAGPSAGAERGRFRDKTTPQLTQDFSNTFGQAYGVIGLARTGTVPDDAIKYLLKQRCAAGYFRIDEVARETCDAGGSTPDVDATAIAIQALITARDHGATLPAGVLNGTVDWLVSVQKANGSFGGGAATEASNSNSTGLAAQALAAASRPTHAAKARGWVKTLQITPANAKGGKAAKDIGAIALNPAGLRAALKNGLTKTSRPIFQRATPQAFFALDPEPLGELSAP
jgi:hypothetical protein